MSKNNREQSLSDVAGMLKFGIKFTQRLLLFTLSVIFIGVVAANLFWLQLYYPITHLAEWNSARNAFVNILCITCLPLFLTSTLALISYVFLSFAFRVLGVLMTLAEYFDKEIISVSNFVLSFTSQSNNATIKAEKNQPAFISIDIPFLRVSLYLLMIHFTLMQTWSWMPIGRDLFLDQPAQNLALSSSTKIAWYSIYSWLDSFSLSVITTFLNFLCPKHGPFTLLELNPRHLGVQIAAVVFRIGLELTTIATFIDWILGRITSKIFDKAFLDQSAS